VNAPDRVLCIQPDPKALAEAAAKRIIAIAAHAVAEHGSFSIALSGGTTPRRTYELLADLGGIEWSRTHVFWSDERAVPPDSPESNYRMAREALLDRVGVPPENIHRMPGEAASLVAAADAYAAEVRSALGVNRTRTPRLDLVLLGLGPDGHTASLFPHTEVLHERHRLVAAVYVPEHNLYRLTFTPKLINAAANVMFIVAGAEKAAALAATLEGPLDPDTYPAQLIHPENGTLYWFVDETAAAALSSRG
jgi:6-phosphogluconolactonase